MEDVTIDISDRDESVFTCGGCALIQTCRMSSFCGEVIPNPPSYNGKAKCSCGSRAKYRIIQMSGNLYACSDHKSKLAYLSGHTNHGHTSDTDNKIW
jgi:hypothetical protein